MSDCFPTDHGFRRAINDELHSHPYEPMTPPERVALFVMRVTPEERQAEKAHLDALAARFGDAVPETNGNRVRYDFGLFRLKVERHLEFTRYKFVWRLEARLPSRPFEDSIHSRLPAEWLANLPGRVLNALNIVLLPFPENASNDSLVQRYAGEFDPASLAGSQVGRSGGLVLTDFTIRDDGFIRMIVFSKATLPAQNGRLILRIVEVETYRSMALLAMPETRKLLTTLPEVEDTLTRLTQAIAATSGKVDEELLDELTQLAARVEGLMASNYLRLSASVAYFELVFKRLEELRERPIDKIPHLGGILERRLKPAQSTCASVSHLLDQISLRVSHTSQLLRTRIDVRRENQNQSLLIGMNKRANMQLRLQETAELLSIAVIPYYGANLLAYMMEGLAELRHFHIDPVMVKAAGAPIIALLTLMVQIRARRR
ncbi:MAG: DUF3422 family protein [Gammaproteobacteria bacterium]|nr:DUF3422 family protein [Gammaproteobacteria bacterium]